MAVNGSVLVVLAVVACSEGGNEGGEVVPFDEAFVLTRRTMLLTAPDDPVGRVSDVVVWDGRIVVVDERGTNVKVFDPDGRLSMTLGRTGRGPGEFMTPYQAAVVNDALAVLDRRETEVSFFDRDGAYSGRWHISAVTPGGLDWMAEGRRFVFAGRLVQDDREGYPSSFLALHELDLDGRVMGSFHPLPEATHRNEGSFNTVLSAAVGTTVVCASRSSNEVFHYDRDTGRSWSARVGSLIYRPVQWMERPADLETIQKWAVRQMWLDGFVALDHERYAVRFVTYTRDLDPAYHYAVVLLDGTTVLVSGPTEVALQAVAGASLYATRVSETGDVELLVYSLPRSTWN